MGIATRTLRLAPAALLLLPFAHTQTASDGSIEGVVVDAASGAGLAGARVRTHNSGGDILDAISDAQGHFRFADLEYGPYVVLARYPGFAGVHPASGSIAVSLEVSANINVRANYPQPARVRIVMQRYAAIVGKVTNSGGFSVEGKTVEAFKRSTGADRMAPWHLDDGFQYARAVSAVTDDRGEFRIAPLDAGTYLVRVQAGYAPQRDTYYPQALTASAAKPIDLAGDAEARADIRIIFQAGVTISGRILGGSSLPNLRVLVGEWDVGPLGPPTNSMVDGTIAAEGHFALHSVLPGKHVIWARQYVNGDLSQTYLAVARKTIEVGAGDIDGVDLALEPPHHVDGSVTFASGCAPETVEIVLQGDSYSSAHAGVDGQFTLQNIWPGKYRVSAYGEKRTTVATSVNLGDTVIPADGFELTSETRGPLRIAMGCAGR